MPLDPELADLMKGELIAGTRHGAALTGVVDRNAVQGLVVVNTTTIQQHASTADDAASYGVRWYEGGEWRRQALGAWAGSKQIPTPDD